MSVICENKNSGSSPLFRLFDPGRPFEKIIRSWGAVQVHRLPDSQGLESPMTLERRILLSGTLKGVLVFRSSPEFADWLKTQRANSSLGYYNAEEHFEELLSLYGLYLFHVFWTPLHHQIGSVHPIPSNPSDWPPQEPHAVCRYQVDGFPVEIRLWMKD